MRLYLNCMSCFREQGRPDTAHYPADLLDEGVAVFECRHGHKSRYLLQAHKFEILTEVAMTAIADGYYREAVTSFTSALERFYEFYVKAILKSKGHELEQIDSFWRRISKQSERQFGAFYMMYMAEVDTPPKALSDNSVGFRNRVIHQGLVPTRKQAIEYGQEVVDTIGNTFDVLKSGHLDLLHKLVVEDLIEKSKKSDSCAALSTHSLAKYFDSADNVGGERKTVIDWVKHVEKMQSSLRRMTI